MPTLTDRLKSLGVQVGAQNLQPARPKRTNPIDQVIPGRYLSTPAGEAFIVEEIFAPGHHYGKVPLSLSSPIETIAEWASDGSVELFERINGCSQSAFAYLDIETTGLSGGTGTYPFLVGIGRFDEQGFRLAQFFMPDPAREPAHLMAIEEFLAPCTTLVTYNGKSFDVPILNTRYATQGWKSPLRVPAHLDLLHLARRLWRERLSSRTLGNVETHILGARRTEEDVPGWMIPQLYFEYLQTGDAAPLKSIFYHNKMDVLAMAAMLNHAAGMLQAPMQAGENDPLELLGVARLYEDVGRIEEACQAYRICIEAGLPSENFWDTLRRLSFIRKRQGQYEEAIHLWKVAAGEKQIYAPVELAKYFEHQVKDCREALYWTESAITLASESIFSYTARQEWLLELEHRRARLLRKLDGRMLPDDQELDKAETD